MYTRSYFVARINTLYLSKLFDEKTAGEHACFFIIEKFIERSNIV